MTEPKPTPLDARAWAKKHTDALLGGGIATTYVAWLLATARGLGFSRDEGFYFSAAYEYQRWFSLLLKAPGKAMERGAIDASWATNHEHPSLMKSLFSLSHLFFYERFKLFHDESTSFRFPGMVMMGIALWVTYAFGARAFSRRVGVMAALMLGLMPNVFYHAHLACFDVPIMAMWIACIYVYWRAEGGGKCSPAASEPLVRPGTGWVIAAGVMYGLTLETKHNAWMLPAVFVPHALLVHGRAMFRQAGKTGRIPVPASLVSMAILGPLLFLLLWPWMWNDTLPRIQEYVNFHVHHEYYNIEFLGRTYFGPPSPWTYMPVMIFATVPTVTLVLFAAGLVDRLRVLAARTSRFALAYVGKGSQWIDRIASWDGSRDRAFTDVLLLLAVIVPLGPFLLPRTPIFGGTKHWITAYPALAILAARGFERAWLAIEGLLRTRGAWSAKNGHLAAAAVAMATLAAPLAITVHSHPFGLSSYVPFVGGAAGAADIGLNRQFWGFTTESLGPYFAKNAPPNATVYIMDTSWPSWVRMVEEKRIPPTLRGVGSPSEAEFSIVHHEQHINEVDYNIWTEYGQVSPDYVLTHDGVPIISVYRRRARR